ncbi:hypothetical protein [Roseiterribacter gracilis]|uniref:Tetratricopeptide repeat protein n=1 Tax=Roseiterribacter gracilis TaxID=2812848 RepID=A0A8S8XIP4_9PROT|nr:hypothetical protein TMPK1_41090 [Rhodospirillales bacterium TMPK1]
MPIADEDRVRDRLRLRLTAETAVLSIAVAVADATLLGAAIDGRLAPWMAAAGHIGVGFALLLWARSSSRRRHGRRVAWLLGLTTITMGPLGAIGTLITMAMIAWYQRSATPFDEWYASLFPDEIKDPVEATYRSIIEGFDGSLERSSVASFTDMMANGTVDQKRSVIALVADNFRTAFAPALRAALNDVEPAVRVQAATAVAQLENQFLERLMKLEEHVADVGDSYDLAWARASLMDDWAAAGLLDKQRSADTRERALVLFAACHRMAPTDVRPLHAMGRLLVRLGRLQEALVEFEKIEQLGAPGTTIVWQLECLYRLGRFSELRALCVRHRAKLLSMRDVPVELADAIEAWAESAAQLPGRPMTERGDPGFAAVVTASFGNQT